jgi:hypothetical protein
LARSAQLEQPVSRADLERAEDPVVHHRPS